VVLVTEAGVKRTVLRGLSAIGDCAYDATADVLYVSDHGLEIPGATTGDTVFAVPGASTAVDLSAAGFSLTRPGNIPGASNVALDINGDIFVSDVSASGSGRIRLIRKTTGLLSDFQTGLNLVGGLAWDVSADSVFARDLFVAQSLDTQLGQINRYNENGAPLGSVTSPSDAVGTADLALTPDGTLLATGVAAGPVMEINPATGAAAPLISGFAYASSIDVDPFTGRIALVSTAATGTGEDTRLHFFVPIERLAHGRLRKESDRRECLLELYGVDVVETKRGRPIARSVCVDGAACDADRSVDGACTFPLGVCVNVRDERVPNCAFDSTTLFEVKKAVPESETLSEFATALGAALPVRGPRCFFSEGVRVSLRATRRGVLKSGKQTVKLKTKGDAPVERSDVDNAKLICEPPA
jgi:hypothetical protein